MAAALKFFYAILILGILGKGCCHCDINSIVISQHQTEHVVNGKPEFEVEVKNNCICTQENVRFSCVGFSSIEEVDPSIFRKEGNTCLLNNGEYFYGFTTIQFKYAWDTHFDLKPIDSVIACS
ncbi:PREDICTED: TPD1 protein homolog 1A-like [Nelumbo nucifera]|uniref:TPD1 protein homolog 1A-like n=1 Tax=Nelumbo nucifera TaxID=4432 RepID=A0A1U7YZ83_NELNU|nr:PREDICTED: TPD1 protein homolog 1A-like [Nelumbo nucifera]